MPTFPTSINGLVLVNTMAQLEALDGAVFNSVMVTQVSGGAQLWGYLPPPQTANGTTIVAGANGSYFGLEPLSGSGGGGGFTNPMTTAGDIIVGGASGAAQRLGIGSAGQVLTVVSGAPAWATPSGGGGGIPATERAINASYDYGILASAAASTNTTAFNSMISAAISEGNEIYLPYGNFTINGPLNVGSSTSTNITGFVFKGAGSINTTITQMGNNMPIFNITGNLMHSFKFEDIGFAYNTLQPVGDTASCVFQINGGSGSSFYNSTFRNIRAQNFNMFFNCTSCSAWGLHMEDIWYGDCSLGINNITAQAGEPRCEFQNLYILAPSCTGVLFTHNAMTAHYDNIECNGLNSGATLLFDDGGGTHMIGHWALEVATYNASGNTILFELHNSVMLANHIYLNTLTIGSGATVYAFHCEQTSGNISYYKVSYAFGVNWTNNGAFYVSDSPGGQKCHLGQVSFPWGSNCALTVATFQAQNVCVDDWNDETNVNFLTNTATQTALTFNSPRMQILNATLTQASSITIPDSTAVPYNLFDGRRFTFVKTNKAAYAFTIKSTNGTTVSSIPASAQGKIELMFDAGSLNAWVVLENTTFS